MEIKTIKIDNKEYEIKVNENKTLTLTEIKKVKTRPYINEKYYSIFTTGIIDDGLFDSYYGERTWNVGNGFFTKEEAEKELERRKVIQLLKEFKLQHDPVVLDWENTLQMKWNLTIDYTNKKTKPLFWRRAKDLNAVYFSSEDLAKQAIKEIGEQRIYNAFK